MFHNRAPNAPLLCNNGTFLILIHSCFLWNCHNFFQVCSFLQHLFCFAKLLLSWVANVIQASFIIFLTNFFHLPRCFYFELLFHNVNFWVLPWIVSTSSTTSLSTSILNCICSSSNCNSNFPMWVENLCLLMFWQK